MPPASALDGAEDASGVTDNALDRRWMTILPTSHLAVLLEIVPACEDSTNPLIGKVGPVQQCLEPTWLGQIVGMHDEVPFDVVRQPGDALVHILVLAAIPLSGKDDQ